MKIFKSELILAFSACVFLNACAVCKDNGSTTVGENNLSMEPAQLVHNPEGKDALGTVPFQGIPSIAVSKSGKRVFLTWYGNGKTESTDNYVMVAYGDSNAQKWSDVAMIVKSPHIGKVRCFDPSLWRDTNGNIWLFWAQSAGDFINRNWVFEYSADKRGIWDRRGGLWCSICKNPDSESPQWSEPKRICDGLMLNKPEVCKDGTWLFPVSMFEVDKITDINTANEGAQIYASKDEGKSFEKINNVKIPNSPFSEHMLVEKKDGSIWLLTRRSPEISMVQSVDKNGAIKQRTYGNDGIFEAFSTDGGKTFGKLTPSSIVHGGSRFCIRRLNSGNLLLLKNYANDEPWLEGKGRSNADLKAYPRKKIIAYLSEDDGKSWKGGLVLDERNNVSYPDFDQDEKGNIYLTYDFNRYGEREIYAAKITESDILAKKLVSPDSVLAVKANKAGIPFAKVEQNRLIKK